MPAVRDDPGSGGPAVESGARTRARKRDQARTAALILLAVLITLFAVLNTEKVNVNWIVGEGHAPLIIVVVISLLVGVVLTHFAERRAAKRR
jgi:uncharacterized integral membrane protein